MKLNKSGSDKSFGLVFSAFFFILAFYFYSRINIISYIFFFLSILFCILSFLKPILLSFLNLHWTKLGYVLSKIFNPIIMLLIYVTVLCLTKFIMFMLKKDMLNIKFDPITNQRKRSYWITRKNFSTSMNDQF